MQKRVLPFTIILAALEVGLLDKGDLLPEGGQLGKACLHLCWGLSWSTLQQTHARRYLWRDRGGVAKTDAWFRLVFYSASEKRFRKHFRVNRLTSTKLNTLLLASARPVFSRRRGGAQVKLELQLAITLSRLGHYGNACSVDAVADLFGVSVGAVIKSTRRVVKVLADAAPQHIQWPNAQRRAALSAFAAKKDGFQQCIGATDGTTFPLAYQPALQPWTYFDRKQRYSLNGLITCSWDCYITNVVLGCSGAAPDTFVPSTAEWHRRPNIFFFTGQFLLGDKGMPYSRFVIRPFKEPECTCAEHRNFNYQLARLRVKFEHAMGILKGRWSSVKELRLVLAADLHFSFALSWITAFIVLQNVCVEVGDGFPEQPVREPSPESAVEPVVGALPRRQQILGRVCAFM